MAPPRTEFVQLVMRHLGIRPTPKEPAGKTALANALGLGAGGFQKVDRWLKGGRIDYEDVMVMLERCGWLNMDEDRPKISDQAKLDGDHLGEIAKTLTVLAQNQALALDALGVPLDVRQPVEPESSPPRARSRRKMAK